MSMVRHGSVRGFRHACVTASDIGRSVRFYRRYFGFRVEKKLTLGGAYLEKVLGRREARLTYVKMRAPGQHRGEPPVFELHCWRPRPKRAPERRGHIALTVKGLDGICRWMRRGGVRFISEPVVDLAGKTRLSFCYDPDGNMIELMEDLARLR
jgi:catechol 2,3-dioxygenase-like lactoylglutathione lyase family enzyme